MGRTFPNRIALLLLLGVLTLLSLVGPARAQEDPWFEIDALNEGLPAPGPDVDRRTPRSAMQSFLEAAEARDWDRAAHVLDLGDIPVAEQRREGPLLAAELHSVLARNVALDWTALNDRPDGLQIIGGSTQAQAGEPRRSILLRDIDLDPVPAAVRLSRVKPAGEEGEAAWVFDRATVADIPALHAAHGPSLFESSLPDGLRDEAFWNLMWWEVLGVPLLLVAALALAIGLRRLFDLLARRTDRALTGNILLSLRAPVIVAAITGLVARVNADLFVFSGTIDVFLDPLIAIGYVSAVLLLIVNLIETLLDHVIGPGPDTDLTHAPNARSRSIATKLNAAKRILLVLVVVIGTAVVLSTADVFRGIGLSLLASAGALTLILGFAARDVLGNVMASLQIAMNQSARVGDRIVYKDELCHVERINMTFIQLKNWDNTRVVVPVKEFAAERFSNWTLEEAPMIRILKLKFAPTADVERLRAAFMEVLEEVSQSELGSELDDLDGASVSVAEQDVFGMDVWFFTPCTDPNTSWEVACTVREKLLARAVEIEKQGELPVFPDAVAGQAA
ncbi:mechanosensitive ion channel family protein [Jannaschia formosa]|uniref:mechanosensitive ion channel family protein n=1 Tax=Jannaschia formosa TaxID=2259592 RepID=UPI000E1C169C|nr:mechanosensitive ion channel domain-containing protein [Jannaschia formosa]TFL17861.1 mechanosensitive ion channel [Jannaschia formosa]